MISRWWEGWYQTFCLHPRCKNIDYGGCVLEYFKSRVLKVFTFFAKSGFGGQLFFWNNLAQDVEMCSNQGANTSDEFVLAVKFQLAYSIIRFAPTSHSHSFIARFGQFEILVRIVLWIHFPCHIVDHICEAKGFPPQIFDFWRTKGFERANICPICSNISNTNRETCFQRTFQGNFDLKVLTLYWLIVPWPPVTFTFTLPVSQTHFHLFAF